MLGSLSLVKNLRFLLRHSRQEIFPPGIETFQALVLASTMARSVPGGEVYVSGNGGPGSIFGGGPPGSIRRCRNRCGGCCGTSRRHITPELFEESHAAKRTAAREQQRSE